VLLWESQSAHFEIQSNTNVEFYEIHSSRIFPLSFLGISPIVNSNHMIDLVIRVEEQCEPSKTLSTSISRWIWARIFDYH
jgi:hypothetical protein